eukprot:10805402-Alexandrium_andersonii.AAC.1
MKVAGPTTSFRTQVPTGAPTQVPTQALATAVPTQHPTEVPTQVPTGAPTEVVQSQMTVLYTVRLSSYNYSIGNGIAVDSQNHAVYVAGHLGNNESVTKVFLAKYNDNSEEM